MKKITLLSFWLISLTGFAQPVINSSDFDNLNFSYTRRVATSTTLNQGTAGANVTWNFSSLALSLDPNPDIPNDNGFRSISQVATGPFSSSFPVSNYVLRFGSGGNGTTNTSSNFFEYYNRTATKLESLGGGVSTQIDFSYTNPSTFFIFPFSFGMVNSDTSQNTGSSVIDTEIKTYDGYGTLITPFGTFTNVIRIKSEYPSFPNDTEYAWYRVSPFRFIMSSYSMSANTTGFDFADPTVLSTQNFSTSKLSIYPNPATNILNIKLFDNAEVSTIVITDLSGKKILEQNGNLKTISIENLANGMYVLEVVSRDDKMTSKFVKN